MINCLVCKRQISLNSHATFAQCIGHNHYYTYMTNGDGLITMHQNGNFIKIEFDIKDRTTEIIAYEKFSLNIILLKKYNEIIDIEKILLLLD